MRSQWCGRPAAVLIVAGALTTSPTDSRAQGIRLRFHSIDMSGGAVFPENSDVGVVFGTRLDVASLLGPNNHVGLGLDFWVAGRAGGEVDVRDVVFTLDLSRELTSSGFVRPYLGLGGALHAVDAALDDDAPVVETTQLEADELDGYRFGVGAFGGTALRATSTGAIWFTLEYRYSVVSDVSNHLLRGGFRLVPAKM